MITDEMMITLAAALTTTLIIILLAIRNAVHKRRLRRSLELLETAKHSKTDAAHFEALKSKIDSAYINQHASGTASFKLSLKMAFGIAVLIGFSGWAFLLFMKDIFIWASVSAVFAVIGLILPFLIWRETKQRNATKNLIGRTISQLEKKINEPAGKPQEQKSAYPSAKSETFSEINVKTYIPDQRKPKMPVPEDSVLRRHALTELRAEIEATLFPRPSDSVLLRHYEQLAESELHNRLINPEILDRFIYIDGIESAPAIERKAPTLSSQASKPVLATSTEAKNFMQYAVPEDCVLRRHLITQLRDEIASKLFPRPTDCVLQRHYDQLIEAELEKRFMDPEELVRFQAIDRPDAYSGDSRAPGPGSVITTMTATQTQSSSGNKTEDKSFGLPEDPVQRSQLIQQLRREIENAFSPRPTDSVLQRHYDQLIESELAMHFK